MIDIYGSNNQLKCSIAPGNNSQQDKSLGGDNLLTLSFVHNRFIALDVNDWCMFNGERYWMQERYLPTQKSSVEWDYDVKFYGVESLIKRLLVLKNPDGENEVVFTLTASASEHVRLIISSINAGMDSRADWKMGTVIATENLTIDYNGIYCDEALRKVAEAANTEWWIEGQTVNVCRCEQGEELTLRYPESITRLERDTADGVKFYTRLFPMGSARNIDRAKYGHVRLQLPDGQKYVDMNVEKYGIFHHYEEAAFADIYPRRIGTVSDVRETSVKDNDGKPFKIYWFKDSTLPFNPNDYEIGGLVKHVVFQSGELNGRDFEVNYHANTKEFEIITTWPYNDGTQLPGGLLVPKKGDKYILWNIRMPDEYYGLAEAEFLTAVKAYNAKHCTDTSVYKCSTHHVWIERGNVQLCIGRRIRLESSSYFPETGFRNSRITRITRSVALPSQMDLEISDAMSTGNMTRLTDNINEAKTYAREALGALPDIIHCGESTLPTDNNLFSARRIIQDFLSKDTDAKVRGLLQFLKGIGIGEQYGINAKGEATISSLLLHALQSYNFNEAEQRGFAIHRRADGKYQLSLTDIIVWGKAAFNELEKRKLSYVGGNFVFSACGSKIKRIVDNGTTWRCYFHQDDGTTATTNLWEVDDQARCQTFNIRAGVYAGVSNRSYWRRVMAKGIDYIDLSKADCEQGSDVPQIDDALVQMGNRAKPERQGLIMLRTTGEPAIIIYSGINGYTLEGKTVALLSPSKVDISANIFRLLSPSGSAIDLKGKDGRDGKSSYTFTRYSDDGGKTFTKAIPLKATGELFAGRNIFALNAGLIAEAGAVLDSSINGVKCTKTKSLNRVGQLFKRFAGNLPRGQFRISGRMKTDGTTFSVNVNMGGVNAGDVIATSDWKAFSLVADRPGYSDAPNYCFVDFRYGMAQSAATALNLYVADLMITQGSEHYDYAPAPEDQQFGLTSGTYLGIASWDKPYPPLDPSVYTWSSTTDKEAMKKAQEAIKTAETANSTAASAATKASDATKRAGEVEMKMQQGEFIVRADKTRFQNNKGQDVAVFNADGTINARAIMAKGTGGTAYFGLYNDAPAMIFTNASGQTTALMTNQGILKPADCVITLRDTKGSMLFKEMYGTTIRAYFTYYIAIRVVNTGFQRTLFGDDTLSPHAQLSLSARFEEYAGSDMQLRCVEPKWIEPQKEQTIVYRATTDHLYPKRYLSAETEFRVSWYAAFEGKVIVAGNFNAREAASKDQGYVSFDY